MSHDTHIFYIVIYINNSSIKYLSLHNSALLDVF